MATMMSTDDEPALKTISEASSVISQTSSDDVNMISFDFQCSLFRVTQHERQDELDAMKMEDLNTRASVLLNEKFPDQSASYPTLGQRLLLYRHDPQCANILQLIRSPKDICHHDVIEVVLSGKFTFNHSTHTHIYPRMPSLINLPFVHLTYNTTYQVNKKLSKAYVLIDSTGRVRPERCNGYDKIAFFGYVSGGQCVCREPHKVG